MPVTEHWWELGEKEKLECVEEEILGWNGIGEVLIIGRGGVSGNGGGKSLNDGKLGTGGE